MTPLRIAGVRLATGVRLCYAEQGDPAGEVIVCLHGYSDSRHSFGRILPLLDPARYRVFALDQRGHGDSERPAGDYTPDDFAADAVAFLEAHGIARATFIGHSMGSIVARRIAEQYPARVARLILIGASVKVANEVTLELGEIVRTLEDPVPPAFVREFQCSTAYRPLPAPFLERVIAESHKLPARVWRDTFAGLLASDDTAQLGLITAPTLLLWGAHDAIAPREEQEMQVATIPNARLTVYPETGHSPIWECPEQVVADIARFLQET